MRAHPSQPTQHYAVYMLSIIERMLQRRRRMSGPLIAHFVVICCCLHGTHGSHRGGSMFRAGAVPNYSANKPSISTVSTTARSTTAYAPAQADFPGFRPSGFVRSGYSPGPLPAGDGWMRSPAAQFGPTPSPWGSSKYGVYSPVGWLGAKTFNYRFSYVMLAMYSLPTYGLFNNRHHMAITYADQEATEVCTVDWVAAPPPPVPAPPPPRPPPALVLPGAPGVYGSSPTVALAAVAAPPPYPPVPPATVPQLDALEDFLNELPLDATQNFDTLNNTMYNQTGVFIADCMRVLVPRRRSAGPSLAAPTHLMMMLAPLLACLLMRAARL